MFSYDPKAIQGYDKSDDGVHNFPGVSFPDLNSGDQYTAYVFFGTPSYEVQELNYPPERPVEAISALFMHDFVMNTFTIQEDLNAAEWVITFPTKNWYVDPAYSEAGRDVFIPDGDDPGSTSGSRVTSIRRAMKMVCWIPRSSRFGRPATT
jgi:hypothetical protein